MEKRIILLLSHVEQNGAMYSNFNHEHAKALTEKGYRVIALIMYGWIPFVTAILRPERKLLNVESIIKLDGVEIHYVRSLSVSNLFRKSKFNPNGFFYFHKVKQYLKKHININEVAFIDAHFLPTAGYAAAKLKKLYPDTPTFVTCHGTHEIGAAQTENGRKNINEVGEIIDKYVCVSSKLQRIMNSAGCVKTTVIYNGMNRYESIANRKAERDPFSVLFVGNLIKRKNADLVIEAIDSLEKNIKEKVKLNIIGEGPERGALEQIAEGKNVFFLGQKTNQEVQELMSKSEVFILPSVDEGFGIVYIEAMLNRCITIGSCGEGIDGIIVNGENGFLVHPDKADIVKQLNTIFNNQYDLERIREQAYESAKELTWDKNAEEYIELADKVREKLHNE